MSCQSNRPGLISRVQLIISDMSWAICSVYMSLTCKMGIISSNISWRLFWGENHVKILAERRYSMDINSLPDYSGTEGDKEKFNPCKPAWDSKWKNMRTHWVTRYLVTMWRDCRKRGRKELSIHLAKFTTWGRSVCTSVWFSFSFIMHLVTTGRNDDKLQNNHEAH